MRIGDARGGVMARKPPEATERQQARRRSKTSRQAHKTDRRTLRTAGFMMLLTSLSGERASATEVVRL